MAEDDKKSLSAGHFKKWTEQLRQNFSLKARILELEDQLSDTKFQLSQSVPGEKVRSLVKQAIPSGRLSRY
jgi:hypothetical protein